MEYREVYKDKGDNNYESQVNQLVVAASTNIVSNVKQWGVVTLLAIILNY